MTTLPFTDYGFKATGGSTDRTMPARLNDTINVKDFGALGDGSTDDTTAIQNAIDYSYSLAALYNPGGTVVFFPPGTYIVNATINIYNTSAPNYGNLWIEGAGRAVTIIKGNVSGFIMRMVGIDLNTQAVNDLTLWNTSTTVGTGGLEFLASTTNTHIFNCHFIGMIGCSFGQLNVGNDNQLDFYMGSVRDCTAESPITIPAANATTPGVITTTTTTPLAGSIGFTIAGGSCINNRAVGFDVGFGLAGGVVAGPMYGCMASRCRIGLYMSLVANGLGAATDMAACGNVFDRCTWGMFIGSIVHGQYSCNVITGTTGCSTPAAISGITWSGGTATATTTVNHNISGAQKIVLTTSIAAWTPDASGDQLVTVTPAAANTFTYALTSSGGGSPTGTWNYPLQAAIQIQHASATTFFSNVMSARVSRASFDTDFIHDGNQVCVSGFSMRGPYGWVMPVNGTTYDQLGSWRFFDCGTAVASSTGAGAAPVMFSKYANVWQQAYSAEGGVNVYDCQAQASFGGIVAGGGSSNHYKIRHNDTDWIRVG